MGSCLSAKSKQRTTAADVEMANLKWLIISLIFIMTTNSARIIFPGDSLLLEEVKGASEEEQQMSCKTLKDCPSLLTSIDKANPNNIFDFLTPCKAKNANNHKENDQDQNPDTFICFQPVFDPWDLAAEMSNCNCKPLPQCPNLMEKFVATQNWTGLKQIPKCGFVNSAKNTHPKYCC